MPTKEEYAATAKAAMLKPESEWTLQDKVAMAMDTSSIDRKMDEMDKLFKDMQHALADNLGGMFGVVHIPKVDKEKVLIKEPTMSGIVEMIRSTQFNKETADDGICFFVYGSLRPDDITDMPWRESFLQGGKCTRGEISGTMYDDSYASVVLPTLGDKKREKSIVQGWIIKYPEALSAQKLKEGDLIEGYPSLYGRERVTVRVHDGTVQVAWCYVRPDCNKKIKVANGDWLVHCHDKNNKDIAQGSSGQNEE